MSSPVNETVAKRTLRDLLRKRSQLVRQKTAVVLSLQSLLARLTGTRFSLRRLQQLTAETLPTLLPFPEHVLSVTSSLTVLECLAKQIRQVEQTVRHEGQTRPGFALLQTVTGIGPVLALTILLETGDIRRFATVGQFASYCRCVSSQYLSNGIRKGAGNTKNGNKYLSWAFVEAAHFAIRYDPLIRRFYQRKAARTAAFVALKAVAHKLARACSHILREQVPFQVPRAFAACPTRGPPRGAHKGGWLRAHGFRLAPRRSTPTPSPTVREAESPRPRATRRVAPRGSHGFCVSASGTRPGTDSSLGHTVYQGQQREPPASLSRLDPTDG